MGDIYSTQIGSGQAPEAWAGTPTTFGQNFDATYDMQYRVDSRDAVMAETLDLWQKNLKAYEEITGNSLKVPKIEIAGRSRDEFTPEANRVDSDVFVASKLAELYGVSSLRVDVRGPEVDSQFEEIEANIAALKDPRLKSFSEIVTDVINLRAEIEQKAGRTQSAAGFLGSIGGFLGGVAGSFSRRDALNLATLGIGGPSKKVAGKILFESGLGGATEAYNQFANIQPNREALGEQTYSPWESIGYSAAGSGAFAGAGHYLGKGVERLSQLRGPEIDRFDFQDRQLAEMLANEPQNSKLRAADYISAEGDRFWLANPYGRSDEGALRFMDELSDLDRMLNNRPDTAVARFFPGNKEAPLGEVNVDFTNAAAKRLEVERPLIHNNMLDAQERLDAINEQIDTVTESIGKLENPTRADQLAIVSQEAFGRVAALEKEIADPVTSKRRRQRLEGQKASIERSFSEKERTRAVSDATIGPRKELASLRASRRAALREVNRAYREYSPALKEIEQQLRPPPKVEEPLTMPEKMEPSPATYLKRDVIRETQVAADAAAKAAPDIAAQRVTSPPVETETGGKLYDIGAEEPVEGGFEFWAENADGEVVKLRLGDEMDDLLADEAMVKAMGICSSGL